MTKYIDGQLLFIKQNFTQTNIPSWPNIKDSNIETSDLWDLILRNSILIISTSQTVIWFVIATKEPRSSRFKIGVSKKGLANYISASILI